ncbi:carbohydrate binding domain-containing protein precursor [Tanacetum coccineum]
MITQGKREARGPSQTAKALPQDPEPTQSWEKTRVQIACSLYSLSTAYKTHDALDVNVNTINLVAISCNTDGYVAVVSPLQGPMILPYLADLNLARERDDSSIGVIILTGKSQTPPICGPDAVPSWKLNGTVKELTSGQKQGGMILIVPEGRHALRLGNDAQISQGVELEKGEIYSITFSASCTCAQLQSLNVSVPLASQTVDLQMLYSVQGWDTYAWAFQADQDDVSVVFTNPGMEDDPTSGPIIDDIAIKKLFVPTKSKDNAVLNGDFKEGPWMFRNASLGVLLPTNLDEETSTLPGWIVESNRAVRYTDSYHFSVPGGKCHARDMCKQPLAVMAFAGDQAENVHYTPNGNSTFQTANVNFTAKAEKTRVAFYSVYYNTRSDDMSSLCGPVADDIRVVVSAGGTEESRVEPIKEEEEKAAEVVATTETKPFKYVASANKLFLTRFACYFPISLIVIMYGLRAMLEKKKEFSDINGHLFQVVLFIFGSVGTLAIYAFYQGVKSKLAKKIGIMKKFMLLLGSRAWN